MSAGEALIETVRAARARELQAEAHLNAAWAAAHDAQQRAWDCRAAREAAESTLHAFTAPPPPCTTIADPIRHAEGFEQALHAARDLHSRPSFTFEGEFTAMIESALAAGAAHRAHVTASAD